MVIKLISRGLKFIPMNSLNKNNIRQQLLRDFDNLQGKCVLNTYPTDKVKVITHSAIHPVQPSVALES